MSIGSSRAKLHGALKELLELWARTRDLWDDQVSQEFEEKHLEPLKRQVRSAADAVTRMDEMLNRAKADCS